MKKTREEQNPLIGAHMSVAGGLYTAFERADRVGCTALQIFTKNSNQWADPELTEEDVKKYREAGNKSKVRTVLSHDSYLINLCAATTDLLNKSRKAFVNEIRRCAAFGVKYIVFHPGAHTTLERDYAVRLVGESINYCHEITSDTDVVSLIETTAGQGTTVGSSFEEIAEMMSIIKNTERAGVCIDTCHIFAAGYDIRTEKGYEDTMLRFDELVGLSKLKAIHVNDAKKPLNSRVDRHEHVGKGEIGKEAFGFIMKDERLASVPKVLETPKGDDGYSMDLENLAILRSLAVNRKGA